MSAETKLTKGAFQTKEAAKRAALRKSVGHMKISVDRCKKALVERVKAMEDEIKFFEKELAAAEGRLAEFETIVSAKKKK